MVHFDVYYFYFKSGLVLGALWTLMSLPALWAALGRRRWELRAAVMVGAVLLLLPTRAHEAVIYLLIYTGVVAAVMAAAGYVAQWRRLAAEGEKRLPRVTFSLRDLLLATALVAVITAVAVHAFKHWNEFSWPDLGRLSLTGFISAWLALACAHLVVGRNRLWLRLTALLLAVIGTCCMRYFDLNWDPTAEYGLGLDGGLVVLERWWQIAHSLISAILPTTIAVLILTASLGMASLAGIFIRENDGSATPVFSHHRRLRMAARVALGLLIVAMLAPSSFIYWRIARPLPAVEQTLPSPNGYDVLLAAAKKLENVTIPEEETSSPQAFATFLQQQQGVLTEARDACQLESRVPIDYSLDSFTTFIDHSSHLRHLSQAFDAAAVAAADKNDFDNAADYALDGITMGNQCGRDGLYIHWLTGIGIELAGVWRMKEFIEVLSAARCREMVQRLYSIDLDRESLALLIQRDKIWERHAYGWILDFGQAVHSLISESYDFDPFMRVGEKRRDAQLRLLMVELALRAYRIDHGSQPSGLQQLVPDYLDRLPIDPFATGSQRLIYRPTDEGEHLLYSVGPNGVDDGGQRVTWPRLQDGQGDFFLWMSDELPTAEESPAEESPADDPPPPQETEVP